MQQPVQILLIEDNPLFVELARRMLAEGKIGDFSLEAFDSLAAGTERLSQGGIDAVLLDLTLPDSSGLETFTRLHAAADSVPIVIFTSVDDEQLSLSALDRGAADYLVKSEVNAAWLAKSLIYAIQRNQPTEKIEEAVDSTDDAVAEPEETVTEPSLETERSAESETRWIVTPNEDRLVKTKVLAQIKSSLLSLLQRPDCDEAYVDLSHVEYLGNAAIGMLLSVHQQSAAADTRLVLCGMKPQVREQLTSRRFDKVFDIQHP
ncbi:MAG TPA: response regulator [Planctomycetes bacterium]|nr:response regulator [Planctomycetota bacterium]